MPVITVSRLTGSGGAATGRRIAERLGASYLNTQVRDEDQRRAKAIRQFYQADWHAPGPFHLILNTALLDEETCVQLVLSAADTLARQSQPFRSL